MERRVVYVSERGGRLTRRAAYNEAAAAIIRRKCDCVHDDCDARPGCMCQRSACRFHDDGSALWSRVHPRLARFLRFVDSRRVVKW